jgi:hypothetical protein
VVGKNELIINHEEMLRALNCYFERLVQQQDQRETQVVDVKQKGAKHGQPFVIYLSPKSGNGNE